MSHVTVSPTRPNGLVANSSSLTRAAGKSTCADWIAMWPTRPRWRSTCQMQCCWWSTRRWGLPPLMNVSWSCCAAAASRSFWRLTRWIPPCRKRTLPTCGVWVWANHTPSPLCTVEARVTCWIECWQFSLSARHEPVNHAIPTSAAWHWWDDQTSASPHCSMHSLDMSASS